MNPDPDESGSEPEETGQADGLATAGPVLALNIGNSMSLAGLVQGQQVGHPVAVETRTIESIGEHLQHLWTHISDNPRARVVIASVVANRTEQLGRIVRQVTGSEALVIRRDLPLPMELDVENPDTVGVDRVCACAAAWHQLRHACVVADVGTAMTVNLVSDDGVFLGGSILPGPQVMAASLAEHTAALPRVQVRRPEHLIGRTTQDAILSGIVFGLAGALRGLTERYAEQIGRWPQLLLTGGGANLLAEHCDFVDNVVPNLALMGIALAWQLSPKR